MGNLSQGEWADVLCCNDKLLDRPEISILNITRRNEILFVDLPTESKTVQSKRLGRLLLQEIVLISGMRKSFPGVLPPNPFPVYVDEFDAFATPAFIPFLNKGRSSGFMIHMAHQSLSDLKKVEPEFAGQLMGCVNVRFIFRTVDPDDVEYLARLMGTRTVIKSTYQSVDGTNTGKASNRETQEFFFSPNLIKTLKVGHCVLSMKAESVQKLLRIPYSPNGPRKQPTGPVQRGPTLPCGEIPGIEIIDTGNYDAVLAESAKGASK